MARGSPLGEWGYPETRRRRTPLGEWGLKQNTPLGECGYPVGLPVARYAHLCDRSS